MDLLSLFGTNVKKYRTEQGLSQEELAFRCGLHRTYISAVERHKRNISLANVQRIADVLGVDPFMLFVEGDI